MRVVFVGGGSGGHFYPLIATAEAIRQRDRESGRDSDLYYMGPDTFNAEALSDQEIIFVKCPSGKQRRYSSIQNFLDIFKIIWGSWVAFWKLLMLYPDVIMSKGGYTSVPIVFAAWLLRIPIVIHESDAVPGRANKFAARFANYIGIAHDDVSSFFPKDKVALVGMPIRSLFFQTFQNPHEILGIPNDLPMILITGGSLGAERLNNFVLDSLNELLPNYTIVHQAGDSHAEKLTESASALIMDHDLLTRYFVQGHLSQEHMAAAMQAAALVITRAGSTTLFELALLGKPAIVVPIPEDVSHDQRTNAYAYARSGGALVIEEHNLSDDLLAAEVKRILNEPGVYQSMSESAKSFTVGTAAYTLADTLIAIAKEHE